MMGAALVVKLRAYTRYTRSREWARALRSVLGLLVVTPDPSQEQRIKRIAQSGAEAGLMVHTTTANHLARAATTRANLAHDAG
jgi:hypothetical protein